MFIGKENCEARQKHWKIYNSWETKFQEIELETDLNDSFNWFAAVWEIAKAQNPDWTGREIDQEKLFRLQKIRSVFTRLGEI